MSKICKTKVLSLLVAVALAVAALPLAVMPAAASVPNRFFIHPATQTVVAGGDFTVEVRMDTNLSTRGGQTDISFDHTRVEVIGVVAGGMYPGGMLLHGPIAEANTTGTLRGVAVMMVPGNRPPTIGGVYVIISMRARAGVTGTSPLTLSEAVGVDAVGARVTMTVTNGNVVVTAPVVVVPVTGVTVAPTTATVVVGATQQLTATVAPANATNRAVTWTSATPAVATVDAAGLVRGVSAGSAVITVTTVDGGRIATSTITVVVAAPVPVIPVTGVTVAPTTATIAVGATQQLTATVAPADATNRAVTWSSGNTAVATVDATGLVTGVRAGSAVITVTTVDGARTATSTITVTVVPPELAGLRVKSLDAEWVTGEAGRRYNVIFRIRNHGNLTAPASLVEVRVDGRPMTNVGIGPMAAGRYTPPITAGPFTLTETAAPRRLEDTIRVVTEGRNYKEFIKSFTPVTPTAVTVVAGALEPAFLSVTVPGSLDMPMVRGVLNTVTLPVEVTAAPAWSWQLRVADTRRVGPGPGEIRVSDDRGHMVDGAEALLHSMKVVHGVRTIDLAVAEGGVLADGAGRQTVRPVLQQFVEHVDAGGNFTITVTVSVIATF